MVDISDLKIGDLIIFESDYYKSCDMIIAFLKEDNKLNKMLIHVIAGNIKHECYSDRILDFYSDAILSQLTKIDNKVWVYSRYDHQPI